MIVSLAFEDQINGLLGQTGIQRLEAFTDALCTQVTLEKIVRWK